MSVGLNGRAKNSPNWEHKYFSSPFTAKSFEICVTASSSIGFRQIINCDWLSVIMVLTQRALSNSNVKYPVSLSPNEKKFEFLNTRSIFFFSVICSPKKPCCFVGGVNCHKKRSCVQRLWISYFDNPQAEPKKSSSSNQYSPLGSPRSGTIPRDEIPFSAAILVSGEEGLTKVLWEYLGRLLT